MPVTTMGLFSLSSAFSSFALCIIIKEAFKRKCRLKPEIKLYHKGVCQRTPRRKMQRYHRFIDHEIQGTASGFPKDRHRHHQAEASSSDQEGLQSSSK